ncbi:hypothetical protein J1614_007584 [Plenodomus biglobosus]|nr:hypothetical protein J1614_007584 [Plenodomus biglobosus]
MSMAGSYNGRRQQGKHARGEEVAGQQTSWKEAVAIVPPAWLAESVAGGGFMGAVRRCIAGSRALIGHAAAFSAFLPLCLEDSRAPPRPI